MHVRLLQLSFLVNYTEWPVSLPDFVHLSDHLFISVTLFHSRRLGFDQWLWAVLRVSTSCIIEVLIQLSHWPHRTVFLVNVTILSSFSVYFKFSYSTPSLDLPLPIPALPTYLYLPTSHFSTHPPIPTFLCLSLLTTTYPYLLLPTTLIFDLQWIYIQEHLRWSILPAALCTDISKYW